MVNFRTIYVEFGLSRSNDIKNVNIHFYFIIILSSDTKCWSKTNHTIIFYITYLTKILRYCVEHIAQHLYATSYYTPKYSKKFTQTKKKSFMYGS
jgi:hypothetical protein